MKANHTEAGLGISRRELAQGISIPQKLEEMCSYYNRMKNLFGEKAKATPSATVELGVVDAGGSDEDDCLDDDSDKAETSGLDQSSIPLARSALLTFAPPPPDTICYISCRLSTAIKRHHNSW
ncbi:unnamed protein product [Phytophthora fragariaefolia]|uniref:Unnamed protein product n=1 Tax=Phytophthora fragariaefolia TaxID=1490495 RepID=A0A9W6XRT3_9STRA|nr:unnamed protein product [Phytophthora fragariaefolia]